GAGERLLRSSPLSGLGAHSGRFWQADRRRFKIFLAGVYGRRRSASSASTASTSDIGPEEGCKAASLASPASFAQRFNEVAVAPPAPPGVTRASWASLARPLFLRGFPPACDARDACDAFLARSSGAARASMRIVRVCPV